jgi:hypothetical protein
MVPCSPLAWEVMMRLDIWDYLTFLAFFIIAAGGVGLAVFILGLTELSRRAKGIAKGDIVDWTCRTSLWSQKSRGRAPNAD